MKLTKLQRYTAYVILMAEAKDQYEFYSGLCKLIGKCLDENPERWSKSDLSLTNLPELKSKGTGRFNCDGDKKEHGPYIFRNWQERIAALQQCINETHP